MILGAKVDMGCPASLEISKQTPRSNFISIPSAYVTQFTSADGYHNDHSSESTNRLQQFFSLATFKKYLTNNGG